MDKIYYTYTYHDPERNVPIYVGKGKKGRAWKHLLLPSDVSNKRFINRLRTLKKKGLEPLITLIEGLTEDEAFNKEKELIKLYGRKDLGLGTLYNMTNGGEGASGHGAYVAASYTPELRAQRSAQFKGKAPPPSQCQNMKKSAGQRWAREDAQQQREHLAEIARARTGDRAHRVKWWSLLAPDEKTNYITKDCGGFCRKHGLSYYGLRNKAVAGDTTPCKKGASKGWSVLFCLWDHELKHQPAESGR